MFEQTLFEIVSAALFVVVLIHGFCRYRPRRLITALSIVAVMVIAEENTVMLSTGNYAYYEYHLYVGLLPVALALDWLVMTYFAFQLSAAVKSRLEIFLWRGGHSNSKSGRVVQSTRSLLPSFLGALIVSGVDLILEPAAYYWGLWVWKVPAPYPTIYYFGAPIGNAAGWLLFTFIGISVLNYLVKKR
jgi:uncharacterized membrane protein